MGDGDDVSGQHASSARSMPLLVAAAAVPVAHASLQISNFRVILDDTGRVVGTGDVWSKDGDVDDPARALLRTESGTSDVGSEGSDGALLAGEEGGSGGKGALPLKCQKNAGKKQSMMSKLMAAGDYSGAGVGIGTRISSAPDVNAAASALRRLAIGARAGTGAGSQGSGNRASSAVVHFTVEGCIGNQSAAATSVASRTISLPLADRSGVGNGNDVLPSARGRQLSTTHPIGVGVGSTPPEPPQPPSLAVEIVWSSDVLPTFAVGPSPSSPRVAPLLAHPRSSIVSSSFHPPSPCVPSTSTLPSSSPPPLPLLPPVSTSTSRAIVAGEDNGHASAER